MTVCVGAAWIADETRMLAKAKKIDKVIFNNDISPFCLLVKEKSRFLTLKREPQYF